MIRATTPTHILKFGFNVLDECKEVLISYYQNGKPVLEKRLSDLIFAGGEDDKYLYRYTLTQEETNKFDASRSVEFQVRVLTKFDEALASKIKTLSVDRVLNDEVLR